MASSSSSGRLARRQHHYQNFTQYLYSSLPAQEEAYGAQTFGQSDHSSSHVMATPARPNLRINVSGSHTTLSPPYAADYAVQPTRARQGHKYNQALGAQNTMSPKRSALKQGSSILGAYAEASSAASSPSLVHGSGARRPASAGRVVHYDPSALKTAGSNNDDHPNGSLHSQSGGAATSGQHHRTHGQNSSPGSPAHGFASGNYRNPGAPNGGFLTDLHNAPSSPGGWSHASYASHASHASAASSMLSARSQAYSTSESGPAGHIVSWDQVNCSQQAKVGYALHVAWPQPQASLRYI